MDQLLTTARLDTLMVEVTSTCNLRCGFCPKGQPGDHLLPGRDEEMAAQFAPTIKQLTADFQVPTVLVSGTGETTFRKDWIAFLGAIREPRSRYALNSNFALDYTDEDLEVMCSLHTITVSVDSFDRETMRRMRSKCDVRKIAYNMAMLRTKLRDRATRPRLVANCTLTTLNAEQVYETWKFCSELGFEAFSLSDLIELDYARDELGIAGWRALGANARSELVSQINRAIGEAQKGGAKFILQASLKQDLEAALRGASADEAGGFALGETRACTQPWRRITIAADGEVFPCCVTAPEIAMGKVTEPGVFNGPKIKALRKALLDGDPPPTCRGCTNAPKGSVEAFRAQVAALA